LGWLLGRLLFRLGFEPRRSPWGWSPTAIETSHVRSTFLLLKSGELGGWHDAQEVARSGVCRVDQGDTDGEALSSAELQGCQRKALAGAKAHMYGLEPLRGADLHRATKRREVSTAQRGRVAKNNIVETLALQVDIDVEANPVGAHIV